VQAGDVLIAVGTEEDLAELRRRADGDGGRVVPGGNGEAPRLGSA
jgi:hypothetical protein